MKLVRGFVVATAVLMPLLACQLIVGIDDHDFSTVESEGGTIIQLPDVIEAARTRCANAIVPVERSEAGDQADLKPIVFAMRNASLRANRKNGGVAGFDLDGVCTCDPADDSLHEGGVSCVSPATPAGAGSCDDDGGIDNALGHLVETFSSIPGFVSPDVSFGSAISCGRQTLLYIVSNYNGLANDPDVVISGFVSPGIHVPHADGGEVDGAACSVNEAQFDAGAAYPAKFDGTDVWSSANGTPPAVGTGWVTNFQLVFDGRTNPGESAQLLPLFLGSQIMTVGSPIFVAHVVPLGENGEVLQTDTAGNILGNGGKASSFRLDDAVLAGRTSASDLLAALGSTRVGGTTDLCAERVPYCFVKNAICSAADSMKLPSSDFAGLECDALSIVLQFDAVVAKLGGKLDLMPRSDAGCGADWKDDCHGGVVCP
ncbi:MAG: hypothetical protein JWP87_179 [Labilithrix sp.]|nr:hypothetical protein [Labilithrix sp.]